MVEHGRRSTLPECYRIKGVWKMYKLNVKYKTYSNKQSTLLMYYKAQSRVIADSAAAMP